MEGPNMEKLRKAMKKLFERAAWIFTVLVVACIAGNIMVPQLVPKRNIFAGIIFCIVLWLLYFFTGQILDWLERLFAKGKADFEAKKEAKKADKAEEESPVKAVSAAKALKVEDAPSEAKAEKKVKPDEDSDEISDEEFWMAMYAKYKAEGKL